MACCAAPRRVLSHPPDHRHDTVIWLFCQTIGDPKRQRDHLPLEKIVQISTHISVPSIAWCVMIGCRRRTVRCEGPGKATTAQSEVLLALRSGGCWWIAPCAVAPNGGGDSAERGATEAPHGARWRAPSPPTAPSGGQALACYAARGLIRRRIRANARLRCDVASPRRLVASEGDQAQRCPRLRSSSVLELSPNLDSFCPIRSGSVSRHLSDHQNNRHRRLDGAGIRAPENSP